MTANARLRAPAALLLLSLASCAAEPPPSGDPSPVGRAAASLTWGLQQQLTPGSGSDVARFGTAVGVSGDTAFVGAPGVGSVQSEVFVYSRSGAHWTQAQVLQPAGALTGTDFGAAVSVSGTTASVTAPGYDGGLGAVYVFTRSGTTWTQQAQITQPGSAQAPGFGASVALNGDTLVVGQDNALQGSATVFTRSGTTWGAPQALLDGAPSPIAGGDGFGVAVALDGDTALVGAPGNSVQAGAVYVFVLSGGAWTQQQALAADDGIPGDQFGSAVAIAGDTALVGAPFHDKFGSAYLYTRAGGTWTQKQKILAPSGTSQFGQSVALSGVEAAIATSTDAVPSGAVFTVDISGIGGPPQTLPTGPTQAMGGIPALAMDGATIVAGAPGASNGVGAAFVFVLASADGDPCNSGDTCLSGSCVDGVCCATPSCPAASTCNAAETCQPGTGLCSTTPTGEGEPCDAGACTTSASCHAGVCQGDVQVCAPADACHEFGVCDPSSGACSNPAKADGQPCPGGTCKGGACVQKTGPSSPSTAHGCGCEVSGSPPGGALLAGVGLALLARIRRRPRGLRCDPGAARTRRRS
jgi:MYXO-CTERM domain-containing protein